MKKLFKSIYSAIPFKKQLFTLLKSVYKPSKSLYQHLHFKGIFKVKINNESSFKVKHYGHQVENEIFWNGLFNGWEKVSLQIWAELCSNAEEIIDVGANTGIYALIAKAVRPNARVIAIEPVKRVCDKLRRNIELNEFDILPLEKAMSNYTGKATIYDKDTDHTYSVTVNKDLSSDKESSLAVEIDTIRFEEVVEKEGLSKVDLMKIDVETHEAEALEGMGKYLNEFQPTMLIEILNDEVANAIHQLIKDIDYVYYVIDENSGVKKVDSLRKSDYFNFLICKQEVADSLSVLKAFEKSYSS